MAVYIDERVCKGCGLCIHFCPKGVLAMSERLNEKGYNVVEVVYPENCNACDLCEINCPDLAIYVTKGVSSTAKAVD